MIVMAFSKDANTYGSIQMRNPDFPDKKRQEVTASFKTAMDGSLYGNAKTVQPTSLAWSFTALPRLKALELRRFVEASAGLDVNLVHFDGSNWVGRLAMDKFDFVTAERGLGAGVPEYANVRIEFEGTKRS